MFGLTGKTLLLFNLLHLPLLHIELSAIFLQYFVSLFIFFTYYLGQESGKKWFKNKEVYVWLYYTIMSNLFMYSYINIYNYNTWIKTNMLVHILSSIVDFHHVFNKWFKQTFIIELPDDRVYQHVY
jgi:hypothetical protein